MVRPIVASSVDVGGRLSRGIHLWCHVMNWALRRVSSGCRIEASRSVPRPMDHRSPGHHDLGSVGEPRHDLCILGSDSSNIHVIDVPTVDGFLDEAACPARVDRVGRNAQHVLLLDQRDGTSAERPG